MGNMKQAYRYSYIDIESARKEKDQSNRKLGVCGDALKETQKKWAVSCRLSGYCRKGPMISLSLPGIISFDMLEGGRQIMKKQFVVGVILAASYCEG